ncbi:hypothetical protein F5882DRAFT_462855 [Hyaloscypha sp. PMI_1271]|nr:hypothetical protein F5882DRAFT_462855 [Hyaloscypha sp. PMI_1271]
MGLSPEAIIGLVTLFVTCAPSAFLLAGWINRRRMLQRVPGLRGARRTYVLHDADIERRLRAGTTLVWNHGLKHLCKTLLKSDENTANHSLPC